ncbi:MAG: hypothetical protein U0164_23875 [Gemmatimonadaceae bacterium]
MSTRRYGDDEVREIFSLATTGGTGDRSVPAESDGLTLEQLQQVAQEAGIDPARVARAAASLDARARIAPVKRALGLPIGVTRVVDLPRAPNDREWEQLVAELRTTFDAPGQARSVGGLREWSNGNLHVCVEPTPRGEQLRLTTTNDGAVALNMLAIFTGGLSVLMATVVAAAGKPEKVLPVFAMFGGISLASFAANVLRLPRWARERERQMEALAEHAVQLLSSPE